MNTRSRAKYHLSRHVVGLDSIALVTFLWTEIMGGYNTADTMLEIGA